MTHFRILEFWRLSAALLVMAYHFMRYAPPETFYISDGLYHLLPLMEMFFMISGFLIMLRYADTLTTERGAYKRFILRRFARLYPLYFATLVFFVAVAVAVKLGYVTAQSPARYDLAVLPQNILLIQGWGTTDLLTFNYVAWTLSAEWFCYLALPAIVLAWRFGGKAGLVAMAVISIIALELAVAAQIIPFPSWLRADTWGAYRAFADFVLGALVAVVVRDSNWQLRSHAPAWIVFGLAIAAMATLQNNYLILFLLMASIFLAALAERNNPDGSRLLTPLHPIGTVSFGIYLIHPVLETTVLAIVWRRLIEPMEIMSFFVFWTIPMVMTIAVALLSYRYFETPVSKYLNGLLMAKDKAPQSRAAVATQQP
ncbi:acyltransferase [Aquamicrobium sp. LC103]|uniref:acyltransferase family protein n=1 Tax=Aquamicrobium sp. LC103 TaxID=1120658 RepID=UPI00063E7B65|nr:acyltransferase [Aquamicrobium sp. LC103]TKT82393.1 acyltransferase [Aquamicrobium sp. LC103]